MRFEKGPLNISETEKFENKEELFTFSHREVIIGGMNLGYVELLIDGKGGRTKIKEIRLEKDVRGKGYGKELYTKLGEELASEGIVLFSDITSYRSGAASGVWNSLVRDGKAKVVAGGYEFISSEQRA
jgi:GNAT superfamily N-acetyltransferase